MGGSSRASPATSTARGITSTSGPTTAGDRTTIGSTKRTSSSRTRWSTTTDSTLAIAWTSSSVTTLRSSSPTGCSSSFTGFDPSSGVGSDGPKSFREVNRIGIDLPQVFLEVHLPRLLTSGGVDLRAGKFYTLMGRELYPGADTDFYSRTYENVYATPFTHTGVMATLHATPTLDVLVGVVRGWDVVKDNNDMVSFHGGFLWESS